MWRSKWIRDNKYILDNNKLIYTIDDLVGLTAYHARQIPKKYANKIISVKKYCTKPELEILLILSEGLYDNFQKVKSSKKPKDFAKENISIGRTKYKNQTKFYADYYGSNVDLLVEAIRKYKSLNKNKKDELYLCDLLA